MLTPKEVINDKMKRRGWRMHEETDLTASYALTLREWMRNLYSHKPNLTKKWIGEGIAPERIERFYRGFGLYLALSQAGFRPETDNAQDWQLTFRPA